MNEGLPVRIGVVVPTYNRAGLVVRAVESALAQTRPPDEIVVVDDGSTDGTAEVLAPYADRIRFVGQPNAGGGAARNRGVEESNAEWIAFLDSDDVWTADHLQRMEHAIRSTDGEAAIYFADTRRTVAEAKRSQWELAGFRIDGTHVLAEDATAWVMLPRQPLMLQSTVVSRGVFLDRGGFRSDLVRRHDTHLFFRLMLDQAACAVAGAGAEMTNDDAAGRLTDTWDEQSRVFWECSVILYRDVCEIPTSDAVRRELRRRLATAHWRLARLGWRNREPRATALSVTRAAVTSPRALTRIVASGIRREWARRVHV